MSDGEGWGMENVREDGWGIEINRVGMTRPLVEPTKEELDSIPDDAEIIMVGWEQDPAPVVMASEWRGLKGDANEWFEEGNARLGSTIIIVVQSPEQEAVAPKTEPRPDVKSEDKIVGEILLENAWLSEPMDISAMLRKAVREARMGYQRMPF